MNLGEINAADDGNFSLSLLFFFTAFLGQSFWKTPTSYYGLTYVQATLIIYGVIGSLTVINKSHLFNYNLIILI